MVEKESETAESRGLEPGDEGIDWSSIPQRTPGGMRVGAGAERRTAVCTACGGTGSYEVDVFVRVPGQAQPQPGKFERVCAVCHGVGRVVEV